MEKRSYEVDDAGKTRAQLLSELAALRRRVAQLEAGEADHKRVEVVLRENEGRFRQSTEDLRHVFAEELRVSREKLESSDQELRITSEQLHTTVEAQQFLNQDLRATHQRLQATNHTLQASYEELQRKTTFLEFLFASLHIGVAVLDHYFTVLSWDRRAEHLWGIWAEEVQGKSFFASKIGLPVEQLRISIDVCLAGKCVPQKVVLDATNRQGRAIKCRVICSRLDNIGADPNHWIVVLMEQMN